MSEHSEQCTIISWAHTMTAMGRYPELAMLFAIPNGGHRVPAVAVKMKAGGVVRGVPDLCLACARGGWHGLFIELKAGKNKTTPEQDEWIEKLTEQGYLATVAYGSEEAIELIEDYLDGKLTAPGYEPEIEPAMVSRVRRPSSLSEREYVALSYVDAFTNRYGYAPSIREIGKQIGVNSTSQVDYYLKKLERLGYLKRATGHVARTWQVTELAYDNVLTGAQA